MIIRAIGDNILIRRLADNPHSLYDAYEVAIPHTPIEIPSTWQAKSMIGQVISCGRGTLTGRGFLIECSVKPGDVVIFDPEAGSEIAIGDETLLIIRESAILGVE